MAEQDGSPGIGIKLIASLLMFGGIYGAIWGLYEEWQILTQVGAGAAAWTGLFVVLFGWCVWVGFELWHDEAWAFRWAKIIFAAQIPIFAVPGFAFDGFFTGLRCSFAICNQPPILRFGFNLASGIHFTISSKVDHWLFGINLLAVTAAFYLMHAKKEPAKDKFGLI